jgi:hypothetical protein
MLSEEEFTEQHHIKMENVNDSEDTNMARENMKENIKISAKHSIVLYEWKKHKLWFGEEFLQFLVQRKPAKMQWLQVPN